METISNPARSGYVCLGHEFPTLVALEAFVESQGLDYARDVAGAEVYVDGECIGRLKLWWSLFDGLFEVIATIY